MITNKKIDSFLLSVVQRLKENGIELENSEWRKRTQNNENYVDFYYYRNGKTYGGGFIEREFTEDNFEKMREYTINSLMRIL
jgi:hypothetical protein